ncbi:helix-turn-helix domain-containing protein [Rubrivirga litoralis]|uniref:Helix-turn-helix transcriptional regulator n=1 Tax=Rubrivirga litoralis TaxID=3075598 RepID=A0ABU3BUJ2_9BACT|nr:helix-turn-helix transcriptional regulator [Rubrivirga sp. F394]MDT0632956.1 helix-turn-helix transcriptional regulator [Rubrivirga sp. F394]
MALTGALGRVVRRERERLKLTQEGLAERSGLHPTYLSGIETGQRNPSLVVLWALARGLDTDLGRLAALVVGEVQAHAAE